MTILVIILLTNNHIDSQHTVVDSWEKRREKAALF